MTTTITLPAFRLRELLDGANLSASTDSYLPVLCATRLSWEGADTVRTEATDRYRLAELTFKRAEVVAEEPGHVLLTKSFVVALVKVLPKKLDRARDAVTAAVVTIDDNGDVTVDHPSGTMKQVDPDLGEFPRVQSLWPAEFTATKEIALNPDLLVTVAKMPRERNIHVSFRFNGPTKPALATYPTATGLDGVPADLTWRFLVMPVKTGVSNS